MRAAYHFRTQAVNNNNYHDRILSHVHHFPQTTARKRNIRFASTSIPKYHVCVVGSGPAGFYTAESLIKLSKDAKVTHKPIEMEVDIIEKLPIPYGLVRFGVAPDHPEVKLVINKFEELIGEQCKFFGNIDVGKDVTIDDLKNHYDAVVLAYGAASDRTLNIPGEQLKNIHSARDFVGWLNGHPHYRHLSFDLSGESAVVIGQGNVALDVARMLLRPVSELKETDITHEAYLALQKSNIKQVHIVGRRGPAQAAFTTKELREILAVTNCTTYILSDEAVLNVESEEELKSNRAQKRLVDLLLSKATRVDNISNVPISEHQKSLFVHFLKSPTHFESKERTQEVKSIVVERNRLEGKNPQKAVGTGQKEEIPCDIAFRSIGYKSLPIPGVPFDTNLGIIPNDKGRVVYTDNAHHHHHSNVYVSGWLKRGPSGIIGTNKWDAEETATVLLQDIVKRNYPKHHKEEHEKAFKGLQNLLQNKGVSHVEFAHWKAIEEQESLRGKQLGKPKEKITSTEEMLRIISEMRKSTK